METIRIHGWDNGEKIESDAVVLTQRHSYYYGPSGNRMRCLYLACIARTPDGKLWLNHPRTPSYPEEVSFETAKWFPAEMFPKCTTELAEMIAEARAVDIK